MLDLLQRELPKSETFEQLTIERRVLLTPKSTIPIANISHLAAITVAVPRRPVRSLAMAAAGLGVVLTGAGLSQGSTMAIAVGGAALAAGILLLRFFATSERPALAVTSSDGQRTLFVGEPHALAETRRLLSDKINADDEHAVYRIDLAKGLVQAGHAEPVDALSRTDSARAGPRQLRHAPDRNGLHGGKRAGNGRYPAAADTHHVDYSQVLPQIVDMQRFYAQRPDTQDIAERLGELEHLMRSGTPTAASRNRVGQLTTELASILAAYPGVVHIFRQAARLAGY